MMWYMDAFHLIESCIEQKILDSAEGGVLVYRQASNEFPEGWYLTPQDELAQDLKDDVKGIQALMSALEEKGITFTPQHPTSF